MLTLLGNPRRTCDGLTRMVPDKTGRPVSVNLGGRPVDGILA